MPVVLGDEVMYNQHFLSLHSAVFCGVRRVARLSRAVLRQASQYSQPPEAPQRTASTLRRLLEGVQQPMLESGAPPAADATPADADPLLEASFTEEDHALELVDLARPRQRRPHPRRRPPPRGLSEELETRRSGTVAGLRRRPRVYGAGRRKSWSGVRCKGGERARLPSLIALDRRDFDPAMQRVWRRDLETVTVAVTSTTLRPRRYTLKEIVGRPFEGCAGLVADAGERSEKTGHDAPRAGALPYVR